MAIRRGGMQTPTAASSVFAIDNPQSQQIDPGLISGFPVDFALGKISNSGTNWYAASRLTGNGYLETNATTAEQNTSSITFDYNNGWWDNVNNANFVGWMWKRAKGYFDVATYTGTGTAGLTVNHSLGVAPEMTWVKRRDSATNWRVNVAALGTDGQDSPSLRLNLNNAAEDDNGSYFGNNNSGGYAAPTSSVLTLGGHGDVNTSGGSYIAYLFATVDGVSKVGSFSHTNGGGDTNVDCGFSGNARLVIYKRTDSTGSWYFFDSVRGIVSGSGDAQLELNSNGAENTGFDLIDPYSSGFKIPSNATGTGDYIFYAIA